MDSLKLEIGATSNLHLFKKNQQAIKINIIG